MSAHKKIKSRAKRRIMRVRRRIKSVGHLPRVSVFRSLKQIYAQVIDDISGKTIVSCSSLELKNLTGDKKNIAHSVGLELAKKAQENGVSIVVFDRGRFLYHGRIKAFADGLRDGGVCL